MSNLTAGIIIIGDEILSGRTLDTNSNFIANELIKAGIKLEQIRTIQDNKENIIDTVKAFHKSYTYVFTTGGIGPTHDDITISSIANGFGVELYESPKIIKIIESFHGKNMTAAHKSNIAIGGNALKASTTDRTIDFRSILFICSVLNATSSFNIWE